MHPEVVSSKKGRCPKCGMTLVHQNDVPLPHTQTSEENSYRPLIIIIGLIFLVTVVLSINTSLENAMRIFMAGFFLVFSGFKLLDIKGFAQGYSTYDLVAARFYPYGFIYPCIELGLGLIYALGITSTTVNVFTFFLMTVSGIGVLLKILKHEKFQCACLGTFLKVPLTKVTLIEDFGMAAMALLMIVLR
jgi:hypothetical protein